MSVAAVKWALQVVRGLTHLQRLVLVAFAEYADREGRTTVTSARVAADLEMAPPHVCKYRKQLVKAGVIKITPGVTLLAMPNVTPEVTNVTPEVTEHYPWGNSHIEPPITTINHQLKKNTKKKKPIEHPRFMEVYGPYPRHVGRARAVAAFSKLDPDDALVDRIVRDVTTRQWSDDPQFIPHLATYLNQERWTDEPDPPAKPKRRGFDPATYQPDWGDEDADTGRVIDGTATRVDRPVDESDRQALAARPRSGQ